MSEDSKFSQAKSGSLLNLVLPHLSSTLEIPFMALTNGRYKSSRHRAVVKSQCDRRSLAFFMNPKGFLIQFAADFESWSSQLLNINANSAQLAADAYFQIHAL
ncbi:hypothetical protein K1719_001517 [Acacia pycnantha]|nr:hypothetical protein K1719_001517 [Acacia pycnantha]